MQTLLTRSRAFQEAHDLKGPGPCDFWGARAPSRVVAGASHATFRGAGEGSALGAVSGCGTGASHLLEGIQGSAGILPAVFRILRNTFVGSRAGCPCHFVRAIALLAFLTASAALAQSVQPPQTVSEAVFRSQWVGTQADRATPYGFGLPQNEIEPVDDWAAKLSEGLSFKSLRISPGLGVGWEFSNRTSLGVETDQADDNSPYVAPTLALDFSREYGPLSLTLAYGGGYVFYVNPDYSSSQSGSGRNPLNQTVQFRIGHVGVRHEASISAAGSYGTGENVQVGGNTTTTSFNLRGDYTYLLTEFVTLGTFVAYNSTFTRYGDNDDSGSNLNSINFGNSVNWLWTGKTTLGVTLEGGISTQEVQGSGGNDSRQYVQLLFTTEHSLTSKLTINAGLGAGYVQSDGVTEVDSAYTGFRPVYQIAINYTPSEKTFIRLSSSFEGVLVAPDYSLQIGWNPRATTSLTASVYQDQNYSQTTTSQVQVNRGFVGTIQQQFFTKLTMSLSAGWQQTENVSLSAAQTGGSSDYDYAFFSANIRWDLNSWLYWQTTIWSSTGNTYQTTGSGDYPETTASTGLNLIF
jgi:hypothetical protein